MHCAICPCDADDQELGLCEIHSSQFRAEAADAKERVERGEPGAVKYAAHLYNNSRRLEIRAMLGGGPLPSLKPRASQPDPEPQHFNKTPEPQPVVLGVLGPITEEEK